MASLAMVQATTLETVQRYAVNAGVLVANVDFSSVTDAATFLAAAKKTPANLLGATSGTTDISEGRKNWSPDHNDLRTPWKGAQWLDTAQPSIKTKLVEMTANNLKLASGGADIEGEDTNAITIKPRTTYKDEDYKTITWFTNYGTNGIIAATLKNALCTTGINFQADDKKVGTCEVEFLGHADSAVATEYLPIEYHIYKSST